MTITELISWLMNTAKYVMIVSKAVILQIHLCSPHVIMSFYGMGVISRYAVKLQHEICFSCQVSAYQLHQLQLNLLLQLNKKAFRQESNLCHALMTQ